MPEILEMRKKWKKKYGNTRVFDHFYMELRDRIGKSWLKSMKETQALGSKLTYHPAKTKKVHIGSRVIDVYVNEWDKIEKDIEKAEKNTWLYVEEKNEQDKAGEYVEEI